MKKLSESVSIDVASPLQICAPGNLSGYRMSSTSATLTWSEPYATCHLCPDAKGYEVSGSTFATVHVTRPPCELQLGNTYGAAHVHVRAKAANGVLSDPSVFVFLPSPGSPTELRATDRTDNGFTLSWLAPVGGVPPFNYVIFRNGQALMTERGVSCAVKHLLLATDVYEVRARSNAGNLSDPGILDITPPRKPVGLGALNFSSKAAVLIWGADNHGEVSRYEVFKNDELTGASQGAAPVFTAVGLTPGVQYTFFVEAVDASGNRSARSDSIVVKTPLLDPPEKVRVSVVTRSSITLVWERPSDAVGIIMYVSEADNHRGSTRKITSVVQGVTFSTLRSSSTYTLTVRAVDAADQYSQPVTLEVTTP
ncbi:fibronectin type III domain-containing protein [Pseudomonas sp. 14P_8.1_Bac3]|uniref:fibronectin type III domain-containing protein n=1 Tax=Pseudomonas sp. 14P_8.1_Bac3 TaxID=2971621 RepID=UPI0021C6B821|nr:fibronectin type III domain-containing protein [Pseudomonas sp. 14P_8.1_Bac3]MCU1761867.1 fibronectin type III domain-containing protein [Pseudomonas sp. 14P_8.1_Bac3]